MLLTLMGAADAPADTARAITARAILVLLRNTLIDHSFTSVTSPLLRNRWMRVYVGFTSLDCKGLRKSTPAPQQNLKNTKQ